MLPPATAELPVICRTALLLIEMDPAHSIVTPVSCRMFVPWPPSWIEPMTMFVSSTTKFDPDKSMIAVSFEPGTVCVFQFFELVHRESLALPVQVAVTCARMDKARVEKQSARRSRIARRRYSRNPTAKRGSVGVSLRACLGCIDISGDYG